MKEFLFALVIVCSAAPARAQDRFEISLNAWFPHANIVLSNDGGADNPIKGTPIDLRQDTGLTDHATGDLTLLFHAARRHTVRFEYLPISYDSTGVLTRDIVFTGATYPAGTTVTSNFEWKSYRFGYQYDFIARPRWTWGLMLELKQTIINERLSGNGGSPARESHVPVPVIGLAVRANVHPRLVLSGDITGFGVPDNARKTYGGHIVDANVTATFPLARHAAADAGYRVIDVGHLGDSDTAFIKMTGVFAGGRLTW